MTTGFVGWFFGVKWWAAFKIVSSIGAPVVCVIGVAWFIYDRYTGGV